MPPLALLWHRFIDHDHNRSIFTPLRSRRPRLIRVSRIAAWLAHALTAVAILFGLASPAHAVSLWTGGAGGTGGSVSVNGLTITVTGCTLILGGTTQTSCAVYSVPSGVTFNGASLVSVTTATGAEFEILGSGTGGNLFSSTAFAGISSLNVTLSITATHGSTVNSLTDALTGSVTRTAERTKISVATSLPVAGQSAPGNLNFSLGTNSGTTTAAVDNFTSLNVKTAPFSMTTLLTDNNVTGAGLQSADTLVLGNATYLFKPAPEPVSIGLFLVGLTGLAVARRRRRA